MDIRTWKAKPYHYLLAPAALYVGLATTYPAIYTVYIGMTNLRWDRPTFRFIGLDNYTYLFQWAPFWNMVRNTLVFAGFATSLSLILGFAIALLLNRNLPGRTLIRGVAVIPWVLPLIVVAAFFRMVFSPSRIGLVNLMLTSLQLPLQSWLTNPVYAMAILIGTQVWNAFGFPMVLCLARLQTVPEELYEAAIIDGASGVQVLANITIPLIRSTLAFAAIMLSASNLNLIAGAYGLTRGGPGRATEVLALAIYKQGFEYYEAGVASAIATILLIVNILLTMLYIRILIGREDSDGH